MDRESSDTPVDEGEQDIDQALALDEHQPEANAGAELTTHGGVSGLDRVDHLLKPHERREQSTGVLWEPFEGFVGEQEGVEDPFHAVSIAFQSRQGVGVFLRRRDSSKAVESPGGHLRIVEGRDSLAADRDPASLHLGQVLPKASEQATTLVERAVVEIASEPPVCGIDKLPRRGEMTLV